jgi:hypothetical protein
MMRVAVFVAVGAPVTVCTAFRCEGFDDLAGLGADAGEHIGDDMIPLDQ